MRALAFALALVSLPVAAQVTVGRWQDLQPYIAAQTTKLNTHTDEIAALQAQVADLTTRLAKAETNIANAVAAHDAAVRYALIAMCYTNSQIASAGWAATLIGMKPFPLGDLECPPAGSRYYTLYYLNPNGPPIPPAQ